MKCTYFIFLHSWHLLLSYSDRVSRSSFAAKRIEQLILFYCQRKKKKQHLLMGTDKVEIVSGPFHGQMFQLAHISGIDV
ncbi:unnamed protein product [Brugia pahangi]|uniref:Secreted protein n=1 Tax=Brugia pahangi TaxID=6280 RepID=A0A0N4TDU3_BRUPA|nr:unnamed protein product [Brugia pahangi]